MFWFICKPNHTIMSFNFGGFLFFNALCDLFDKAAEPISTPNKPMPTHIKWAAFVCAICLIGAILVIAYTL